ncbi:hypothetical protein GCM10025331_52060 [Actinoplanes utahensis]|nr:hypothetical protein Aut01nite_59660 [Actinoplanes utahensis]
MRRIAVLDAPSNLGLRPPTATSVPGCAKAPGALRDQGLLTRLGARDAGCLTPPRYDPGDWRPGDGVAHAAEIAAYSRALADRIGAIIDGGEFPVVLGGDCSILIGSGIAMHRLGDAVGGRIGLVFVDGHSDFRHPGNASYVGAAAGEDLALVTGRGQADLAAIESRRPYFRDIDVVVLGIRAQDEYRLDLQAAGIVTRPVPALRAEGAARSAQWARDQLVDCAGYWVHMDVDVLDPAVMPAVDAPDPGGIAFPELELLLSGLVESPHCLGVEITVFDPDYDPDGRYAAEITSAIVSGLSPVRATTARPDLIAARLDLATTPAVIPEQPSGADEPAVSGQSAAVASLDRTHPRDVASSPRDVASRSRDVASRSRDVVNGSRDVADGPPDMTDARRDQASVSGEPAVTDHRWPTPERGAAAGQSAGPAPDAPSRSPDAEFVLAATLGTTRNGGASTDLPGHADVTVPAEHDDTFVPAEPGDTFGPARPDDSPVPAEFHGTSVPIEPDGTSVPTEPDGTSVRTAPGDASVPTELDDTSTPVEPGDTFGTAGPDDGFETGEPGETAVPGEPADTSVPSDTVDSSDADEAGEGPAGEESEPVDAEAGESSGTESPAEPETEREPEPALEAAPEPEPELEAAPESEPELEAAPESEPELEAAPEPEPVPEPEPTPEPVRPDIRLLTRPLGSAPLLDSEPLPATRPGMLRPRPPVDSPQAGEYVPPAVGPGAFGGFPQGAA